MTTPGSQPQQNLNLDYNSSKQDLKQHLNSKSSRTSVKALSFFPAKPQLSAVINFWSTQLYPQC